MAAKDVRCPFCLHSEWRVHKREEADNDYYAAQCLNCSAEGPLSATRKGAEKLWKHRETRHIYAIEEEAGAFCVCGQPE